MSIGHPELSVGAPSGPSSQGLKEPGQTPHHSTRRAAFQKLVTPQAGRPSRLGFPEPSLSHHPEALRHRPPSTDEATKTMVR